MLSVNELESGYGSMQVLWKPSIEVEKGTITSLLGPNGVGKSTLLGTIFGSVEPWAGRVTYNGQDITTVPTHKKVELGIALVPEGKHLFPGMTVYENLSMGAYLKKAMVRKRESLDLVYSLFPRLKERSKQMAGSLSGGEQQMVTIARGLMTKPELMMAGRAQPGTGPKIGGRGFRNDSQNESGSRLNDSSGGTECRCVAECCRLCLCHARRCDQGQRDS